MARVIRQPDAMAAFNAPCHSSATNAAKTLCGGRLSPSDSQKQKSNVAAGDGSADFAADGVASDKVAAGGVTADGVAANGVAADGVAADGVEGNGVAADG